MIDFIQFIKFLILKYHYTYNQFSIITGVDKISVYRWMNYLAFPSYKIVCHLLFCFPDDFIEWYVPYIEENSGQDQRPRF